MAQSPSKASAGKTTPAKKLPVPPKTLEGAKKAATAKPKAATAKTASAKEPAKTPAKKGTARTPVPKGNGEVAAPKKAVKTARGMAGVTPEQRYRMICDAAYFRAERRGFVGGNAVQDWLDAEAEIDELLREMQE
jgi:hypothetical protein